MVVKRHGGEPRDRDGNEKAMSHEGGKEAGMMAERKGVEQRGNDEGEKSRRVAESSRQVVETGRE